MSNSRQPARCWTSNDHSICRVLVDPSHSRESQQHIIRIADSHVAAVHRHRQVRVRIRTRRDMQHPTDNLRLDRRQHRHRRTDRSETNCLTSFGLSRSNLRRPQYLVALGKFVLADDVALPRLSPRTVSQQSGARSRPCQSLFKFLLPTTRRRGTFCSVIPPAWPCRTGLMC